jgi:hypothetical protein
LDEGFFRKLRPSDSGVVVGKNSKPVEALKYRYTINGITVE